MRKERGLSIIHSSALSRWPYTGAYESLGVVRRRRFQRLRRYAFHRIQRRSEETRTTIDLEAARFSGTQGLHAPQNRDLV